MTSESSNDESQQNSQESATSATVSVSSPVTLTADSEPPNSQVSESDATTASLSQDFASHSKTVAEKECQTTDGVYLSNREFEELLKKASFNLDFKNDLQKIKDVVSNLEQPEMNPHIFEQMCKTAGAENFYLSIKNAMWSERMSEERKQLCSVRTMVVIYIMLYSQSQKCNSFQVALSRTLQQFGISNKGLESLRNLGIAAHPRTVKILTRSSSSHNSHVFTFIKAAIENNQFLIFCIDDYHNIHTHHRPEAKTQTQAIHMATLLLKVFPEIEAVPQHGNNVLPTPPVKIEDVKNYVASNLSSLSKTYAENMPDWVLAKYFNPEAERQRLLVHDYQQTENQQMRSMDNTKLVDSIKLPLKSCEDALVAINKMLTSGLDIYLNHFVGIFVGDWPMQFFIRQLVYSNAASIPKELKNVVPLIGPLHISLNARECVLLNFHQVFADLYSFLFGRKAKLAKKPKPWRISLLLEVMYGGWTLVRDMIMSVFCKCKDVQFLTLVNLLDNYIPLVLSIYSIIFKCNKYDLFFKSLLNIWVMFVLFRRRHYNKALLIMLSTFLHWQGNAPSMFETIREHLAAFDEYPVENFHSVLRRRTKDTDTADEIAAKAKEIDACKHELHSFQSTFVPPKKFNFSSKRINKLKTQAAEFLTLKFELLFTHPNVAVQQPRTKGQPQHTSKWLLPNLFGEKIVTNQVLPLGFNSMETPPNPNM